MNEELTEPEVYLLRSFKGPYPLQILRPDKTIQSLKRKSILKEFLISSWSSNFYVLTESGQAVRALLD